MDALDTPFLQDLARNSGFNPETLQEFRAKLNDGARGNEIEGRVTAPEPSALTRITREAKERWKALGEAAIGNGQVGTVVLAGGMATRFGGAVKALVPVLSGHSFLELKIRDLQQLARRLEARIPLFLMTSLATEDAIRPIAEQRSTDAVPILTFTQFASLRLTPDGSLFEVDDRPSPYATGHGDLPFALKRHGIIDSFHSAGGSILFMSNVDNLGATLDPFVIGAHLEGGKGITVEVCEKAPGDAGGAPAMVDGRLQIVEGFRFPKTFDQDSIPVFNTNTMTFSLDVLRQDRALTWFRAEKTVDGRQAIQFERLVGELTAFEPSQFLVVDREGPDGRFQPIKTPDDLELRKTALNAILRSRGVLDS